MVVDILLSETQVRSKGDARRTEFFVTDDPERFAREAGTRVVRVDADLCLGCHSCSIACPFGVPRFGEDGTMQKCDLCSVRLEHGLEPACVRVCPSKALRQGSPNVLGSDVEKKAAGRLAAGS